MSCITYVRGAEFDNGAKGMVQEFGYIHCREPQPEMIGRPGLFGLCILGSM